MQAATGVLAPSRRPCNLEKPLGRFSIKKLQTRAASALALAPVFLFVIWWGGSVFNLFLISMAFLACYEWAKLTEKMTARFLMLGGGVLYISICFASFYLLRTNHPEYVTMFFVGLVFASDTGAYFAGKLIGGPKMAVSISPNKTLAGLGGAILSPALLALVFSLFSGDVSIENMGLALMIGAALGLVGQAGDLLVSYFKRVAKIKDTGNLIPGHGGLLDRIDAMMLACPVFLFMMLMWSDVF